MSDKKFCPECGNVIEDGELFCQNCGTQLPSGNDTADNNAIIGAGARANIMGGVSKTTNNNTSNVDNSSTVNNNTTYVMAGNKSEYCEVCGNPLEEKHPRCPKCGKEICPDCKVNGKNRCVECEKKAKEDYRMAFQQLLLTTNGNIGIAGRQMMDQKARELDIEDSKEKIEKELAGMYKPEPKAVQPEVKPTVNAAPFIRPDVTVGQKNAISPENSKEMTTSNNSSSLKWIIPVAVIAAIIVFFMLPSESEKGAADSQPTDTATVVQQQQPAVSGEPVQTTPTGVTSQPKTTIIDSSEKTTEETAVTEKADANYDAGMKAYDAGEGLEAINRFSKSGSAKSYYMIGIIYESGCGNVGPNDLMARKNFKKAAKLGSAEAKAKL